MRNSWYAIRYLIGLSWRADRSRTVTSIVATPIVAVVGTSVSYWLKLVVDGSVRHRTALALAAALAVAMSIAIQHLLVLSLAKMRMTVEEKTGLELDSSIVRLVAETPGLEHFERPEYLARLDNLRYRRILLRRSLNGLLAGLGVAFRLASGVVLLASVNRLLLVLPVCSLPMLWAGRASERAYQAARQRTVANERLAWHLYDLATTASTSGELRGWNLSGEIQRRYRELWWSSYRAYSRMERLSALYNAAALSVFASGYAAAIGWVCWQALRGSATPGDVLLCVTVAAQLNLSLTGLVQTITVIYRQLRVAEDLFWMQEHAARTVRGQSAPPGPVGDGIVMSNVSFRYPGTDKVVLDDVTISLRPGTVTALVGSNGAGKTSIVKLLCRFYEPDAGVIRVDGQDLSDTAHDAWLACVSAGFQDFHRFEFRAATSIGIGNLNAIEDDTAILAAVTRAGADDLPSSLPAGLSTQLGSSWPAGVDLSTGQWQKIALSRAMMRTPALLILDEPTASLDAETEYQLFERYAHAVRGHGGQIAILVSHRFSTVRMADQIVVIEGGRVVEHGSHAELMAAGQRYADLYNLQAAGYR